MRIATWNVNSLKARLEKVTWWLGRAQPDVLLMQETKLADADAPRRRVPRAPATRSRTTARAAGTAWPSPAASASPTWSRTSASRCARRHARGRGDDEPLAEARMISAVLRRRPRRAASTRRTAASSARRSTRPSSAWYERLARWLARRATPGEPLVLGGDFNVAPADADVWDPARLPRRHARLARREREAFARALRAGASSTSTAAHAPSPAATPGGTIGPATSTRTSACASTTCWSPPRSRAAWSWAEIDREARKGKPMPSDHAPLVIDLDEPGLAFDAGWTDAEGRIASRRAR